MRTPLRDAAPEDDGLKGLARRLTQRKPRKDGTGGAPSWEMKQLLAAVESDEPRALHRPSNAQALAALRKWTRWPTWRWTCRRWRPSEPTDEQEWKSYLAGDRAIFARTLAETIDVDAVDRITALYRDDERFHAAADAYLGEFESRCWRKAARWRCRWDCWSRPLLPRLTPARSISPSLMRWGASKCCAC